MCCLQLTWLLDDNGIPANWANMEGYGVNTFKLINAEGKESLCKFHLLPKEGENASPVPAIAHACCQSMPDLAQTPIMMQCDALGRVPCTDRIIVIWKFICQACSSALLLKASCQELSGWVRVLGASTSSGSGVSHLVGLLMQAPSF